MISESRKIFNETFYALLLLGLPMYKAYVRTTRVYKFI